MGPWHPNILGTVSWTTELLIKVPVKDHVTPHSYSVNYEFNHKFCSWNHHIFDGLPIIFDGWTIIFYRWTTVLDDKTPILDGSTTIFAWSNRLPVFFKATAPSSGAPTGWSASAQRRPAADCRRWSASSVPRKLWPLVAGVFHRFDGKISWENSWENWWENDAWT